MRKLLIALVLALAPLAASAAPTCYPFGIKGESRFDASWFKRTDNGWYAFWLCKPAAQGLWVGHGLYCRHGACVQAEWLAAQIAIGQAADRAAAADAEYTARVTAGACQQEIANATPNAPICRDLVTAMEAAVTAANPAPPPPEVWNVVAAAANANPPGTVPVYRWDGTVRGTAISGLRAQSGATCDCKIARSATSTATYCAVPSLGRTDAVARCVKQ